MPEYPDPGWSTGTMKKKGSKLGPDFEHAFRETASPFARMTPAQQVFERSRPELPESASGKAEPVPTDIDFANALTPKKLEMIMKMANAMGIHGVKTYGQLTQLAPEWQKRGNERDFDLAKSMIEWWNKSGKPKEAEAE